MHKAHKLEGFGIFHFYFCFVFGVISEIGRHILHLVYLVIEILIPKHFVYGLIRF